MSGDFWRRLRLPWLAPRDVEREFDDELDFHIDMRTRELIAAGVDPQEAHRRAMDAYGDLSVTRSAYVSGRERHVRKRRAVMRLEDLATDVRLGVRQLARDPGFTVVAVVTLALGIGANAAVFSVVNAVLLRPLPYPDADRIVRVWGTIPERGEARNNMSPPDLLDMARETSTLAALAAFSPGNATVSGLAEAEHVREVLVMPSMFDVLGVRPALGRGFAPVESSPEAPEVVVLSHGYWERRFASDSEVLGRTLLVDQTPHTVVGVLPPGLVFPTIAPPEQPDLVRPLRVGPENGRGGHWLRAVGRLSSTATVEAADGEVRDIARRLEAEHPDTNTGFSARVEELKAATIGSSATGLWVIQGAVLLVLLIACANVANLMLVRGGARTSELAVRRAIGAGRGRLTRQLLAENLVLSALGGAAGLLLAVLTTRLLVSMPGSGVPRADEITVDSAALLFCAAVALGSGFLASLAPLAQALRTELRAGLAGRRDRRVLPGSRLGSGLVSGEAALALVLLAGAGLLLRSFGRLIGEDAGVDTTGAMVVEVILPQDRYDTSEAIGAFYADWVTSLEELPGVRAVGGVNNLPFFYESCDGFRLPDRPDPPPGQRPCASNQLVTPGYFAAAGIRLVEGREFSAADRDDSRPVVIVSEVFADRFWPSESALGREVAYNGIAREVVGVSAAVRRLGLAREAPPEMFIPHAQDSWDAQMFVIARTDGDADAVVRQVRTALAAADPNVPVGRIMALRTLVSNTVAAPRFRTVTLGVFAAVALALAGVGVYGVLAHSVSQRRRELGIRLALGADAGQVRGMVLRHGLRLTAVGVAVGLVGALLAARILAGLLYETATLDPPSLLGAAAALFLAAALGAWLPARRAMRASPLAALNAD